MNQLSSEACVVALHACMRDRGSFTIPKVALKKQMNDDNFNRRRAKLMRNWDSGSLNKNETNGGSNPFPMRPCFQSI